MANPARGEGKGRGREKLCQTLGKNLGDCFSLGVMVFGTSTVGRWMCAPGTGLAEQLYGDEAGFVALSGMQESSSHFGSGFAAIPV